MQILFLSESNLAEPVASNDDGTKYAQFIRGIIDENCKESSSDILNFLLEVRETICLHYFLTA